MDHDPSAPQRSCERCHAVVPDFSVDVQAFKAMERALANGSKTLAAAELKHHVSCTDLEAQAWVSHLLACAYAWPTAEADERVLRKIEQVFAAIEKPEHFTEYEHCDECKEHDDTLLARTRDTLRREDLGSAGWDPVNFCSAEGIGYLFPALSRFALLPSLWSDRDWYGSQLIWHLSYEGGSNRFLAWCSPNQCDAVYELLRHLQETRLQDVRNYGDEESLVAALEAWRPPGSLR